MVRDWRRRRRVGPVTIEGLLTHASGLPRESDYPVLDGPGFSFPTRDQVVARVPSQRMLYPAETYWQYRISA